MKNSLKLFRFMAAAFLPLIAFQSTLHAESNGDPTASSALSAIQIIGGFALLLFVLLMPLVKGRKKTHLH